MVEKIVRPLTTANRASLVDPREIAEPVVVASDAGFVNFDGADELARDAVETGELRGLVRLRDRPLHARRVELKRDGSPVLRWDRQRSEKKDPNQDGDRSKNHRLQAYMPKMAFVRRYFTTSSAYAPKNSPRFSQPL